MGFTAGQSTAGESTARGFFSVVVLAAGGSSRLGRPKQLLPYAGTTLLGATVTGARTFGADEVIVTLGRAADAVTAHVDLRGVRVVRNNEFGTGCSSSIAAALAQVDHRADGVVLVLGDQPRIDPAAVRALVAAARPARLGACRYTDGLGHPFWLGRRIFGEVARLHGDKGVWKLIDAAGGDLVTVDVDAATPIDVDTEADYRRLLDQSPAAPGVPR